MTKKETIYNALGMIEGAVCVSQKNTRDVLMKAIEMIKNAVEEDAESKCGCDHKWEAREVFNYDDNNCLARYVCVNCGETEYRKL